MWPLLYLAIVAWTLNFFVTFATIFKEQSRYVQGKYFYKSEKMEKSNRLANQEKIAAAFLFYHVRRDFKLYFQSFQ